MDGTLLELINMIFTALTEWETLALESIQAIFDQVGWWGVSGFMVVETSTGVGSSEIVLVLAGWLLLASHDMPVISVLLGGLYAALASVAGASVQYWAARKGGRLLLDRIAGWLRMNPKRIQRVEAAIQRRGAWAVAAGRVIPFVRSIISILAGLGRVPYPSFAAATFAGAYVYCTVLIGAGYFLGHQLASQGLGRYSWDILRDRLPSASLAAAAITVIAVLAWITWRGVRRLRQKEVRERYGRTAKQ